MLRCDGQELIAEGVWRELGMCRCPGRPPVDMNIAQAIHQCAASASSSAGNIGDGAHPNLYHGSRI